MAIVVRVQAGDFDAGAELAALHAGQPAVGAVVSFVGLVRDRNVVADRQADVGALTLEHYPGMTERSLEDICARACARWSLIDALVIHRHGRLRPTDRIVMVAASSAHRDHAFDACRFIIDWLKTDAPFWKKESTPAGDRWVEARDSDHESAARWTTEATKTA